jgi:hypothetical protein
MVKVLYYIYTEGTQMIPENTELAQGLLWNVHKTHTKPKHTDVPPKLMTQVSLLVRKGGVGLLRRFTYEEETINTFTAKLNARRAAQDQGLKFCYWDDVIQYETKRLPKPRKNQ